MHILSQYLVCTKIIRNIRGDGKVKKKIRIKFMNWIDKDGHKRVVIVGKNF